MKSVQKFSKNSHPPSSIECCFLDLMEQAFHKSHWAPAVSAILYLEIEMFYEIVIVIVLNQVAAENSTLPTTLRKYTDL